MLGSAGDGPQLHTRLSSEAQTVAERGNSKVEKSTSDRRIFRKFLMFSWIAISVPKCHLVNFQASESKVSRMYFKISLDSKNYVKCKSLGMNISILHKSFSSTTTKALRAEGATGANFKLSWLG
jgi:hypothetical protein